MFTGIVEEKGSVRYMRSQWSVSDSYITSAGWIYCRCDGRDHQEKQSGKL